MILHINSYFFIARWLLFFAMKYQSPSCVVQPWISLVRESSGVILLQRSTQNTIFLLFRKEAGSIPHLPINVPSMSSNLCDCMLLTQRLIPSSDHRANPKFPEFLPVHPNPDDQMDCYCCYSVKKKSRTTTIDWQIVDIPDTQSFQRQTEILKNTKRKYKS